MLITHFLKFKWLLCLFSEGEAGGLRAMECRETWSEYRGNKNSEAHPDQSKKSDLQGSLRTKYN